MHAIENALATLRAAEWMPITAVRVSIGIFFCISGGTKLFVPSQFSTMHRRGVSNSRRGMRLGLVVPCEDCGPDPFCESRPRGSF